MKNILFLIVLLTSFTSNAQIGQWQLCNMGSCNYFNRSFIESQGKLFSTGCYSMDNGITWSAPAGNTGAYSYEINSAGIFAGSSSAIYFSNTNGSTWTNVHNFGTLNFVFGMAKLNDTIYAATFSQGIWMTPDNGNTWAAMNSGLTTDSIYSILSVNNLLYAGTFSNGIFISANSGLSWAPINNGLPVNATIRSMTSDNINIYASTTDALYYSNNNGASWMQAGIPTTHVGKVIAVGNALLVGGANFSGTEGLFRSLDQGNSWSLYDSGLPNSCIYVVGSLYATSNYVFCGLGETYQPCSSTDIYRIDRNSVTTSFSESENLNQIIVEEYPNPFSESVSFKSTSKTTVDIILYDVAKRTILNQSFIASISINTSKLDQGIYFYECRNKDGLINSGKIIKN